MFVHSDEVALPKFRDFQFVDESAPNESMLVKQVISIEGNPAGHHSGGQVLFTSLDPLAGDKTKPRNPDLYYGARPGLLKEAIREKLNHFIQPTTQANEPIAPNFLLAVKGTTGTHWVAVQQVCYDDALSARAILSLQSYGFHKQIDGRRAYKLTTIFHTGHPPLIESSTAAAAASAQSYPDPAELVSRKLDRQFTHFSEIR